MGRVYARPLHHDGYVFGCACCKTPFAKRSDLINPHFRGRTGAAWLFDKVINVNSGEPEQAEMTTGPHRIRPVFCVRCQINVGWLYERAFVHDQRYKEGKFILEKAMLLEWLGQSASKIRGPCGPGLETMNGGRGRSAVGEGERAGAGDSSCHLRGARTHEDPAGNEIIVPAVPAEQDAEEAGAGGSGGRSATNNGGQLVSRSAPPLAEGLTEGLSTLMSSLSSMREDAAIPGTRDSSVGGEENKDEEVEEAMPRWVTNMNNEMERIRFITTNNEIERFRFVLASHRDTGHRDHEQQSTASSS